MENRTQRILLACLLGLGINAWADDSAIEPTASDQVIEPDIKRRQPEQDAIDTENFEVGVYYGGLSIQDFGSSPSMGVSVAYHLTEDFFFQADYGISEGDETSFEKLSGGAPLLSDDDRDYKYYTANVGWNILPGEVFIGSRWAFNSALYIIGGVGRTEFAGDSHYTVAFGAGYRLVLTDWLAWHVDVRDYWFRRDTFGDGEHTHNIEYRTGLTVFF